MSWRSSLTTSTRTSALYLRCISPISRPHLQVELDDFNTHLRPHRTDKLGQVRARARVGVSGIANPNPDPYP